MATEEGRLRSVATEVKFMIEASEGARIRDWARQHLVADSYGGGPFGDEYRTTSLYFDTDQRDVFHRRGSFGRSKHRIRRYGNSPDVFLERKLRLRDVVHKRRCRVPLADLTRLAHANGEWAGTWFDRRLKLRRLLPTCLITYDRTARVLEVDGATVRLTIDDQVTGAPMDAVTFEASPGTPLLDGWMILELKFRDHLPAIFRRLVEDYNLQAEPASKYRLTMSELGTKVQAQTV